MKKYPLKSEDHHWWPKCVSKHWKDDQGFVHRLSADGIDDIYKKHEKLGYITDAHSIKFADKPTDWDECFESSFDSVDNNKGFRYIIAWLKSLESSIDSPKEEQDNLDKLLECVLSLIVRSPRFRNQIKLNIDITGTSLRKNLISLNQRDTFHKFKTALLDHGKFCIAFSRDYEFIFGDGFYNNFTSSIGAPIEPRAIVPILPNICVFYSHPSYCKRNPRLITIELEQTEVDFINQTTMIYSQNYVFYRSQKPIITESFSCKKFLKYDPNGDPVIDAFSKIFHSPRRSD
ncbi:MULTISPECIES: hypothetical protein [Methylomicrobium]|uniref:DUF4238 domain-containing protein n=1 Tax=Methylomicrobium album BG8 TaxID=686340 RepID=H8GHM0_METAL|nr:MULTISPECIES: hypothetical protein [Methylomicrobium]EIC31338.1 hypothetical protein Metal_3691 [Methylomicrobium album BG8]